MRVLVATDGSKQAQTAVAWSADFIDAIGATAVLATIIEPVESELGMAEQRRQINALLERTWAEPLRRRGIPVELATAEGDARIRLVELAAGGDIDTVVMGTRGIGGFADLGLGSVAHYLARHIHCPLIAIPAAGGPVTGGVIVVGVDGSAANEQAIRWAVRTGGLLGARVLAVHVRSPLSDVMTHTAANWTYPGEDAIQAALARAGAGIGGIEFRSVAGNAVEELVRIGAEEHATLVVAGRRGWGGVRGLVLGRVPAQLLHHAYGPVALIPH